MLTEEQLVTPKLSKTKKLTFLFFLIIFATSLITIIVFKQISSQTNDSLVTIRDQEFSVKIAETERERSQGLRNIDFLPTQEGMLFIYQEESYRTFWMKDTLIPLDMIFIDDSYHIVKIIHNVQPCEKEFCDKYRCEKKAKYVLEINAGLSKEYEFKMGDAIEFSL